jgi:AraC-like DNA-binding protein
MTTNIILILAAFLGYIIILITLKSAKYNKILNLFLLVIIFISSTLKLIVGIAEINNDNELKIFYLKANTYITLLLPGFYLYFKYLVRNHKQLIFKDLAHILFLLLATLEREFLILDSIVGFKLNYNIYHFFTIYAIVYLIMIFLLLQKNVWNKKATLSFIINQNNLIKKWTILLFIVIVLFISRYLILYSKQYFFSESIGIDYYSIKYLWLTSLVWIVLFIIILSNPEILYGYSYLKVESTKANSNSNGNNYWIIDSKIKINNNQDQLLKEKIEAKIEGYIFNLNEVLYKNSYFKNAGFSIKDLAQALNIPISHLKFVFKYHSKLSFSDYKKISRIQNSLELINNNYLASNTLESLSNEVGFSSYNPFFTSFKDVVGKSPHQYISSVKKE